MKKGIFAILFFVLFIATISTYVIFTTSSQEFSIHWKGKCVLYPRYLRYRHTLVLHFHYNKDSKKISLKSAIINWDRAERAYTLNCIINITLSSNNTSKIILLKDHSKNTYEFTNISCKIPTILIISILDNNEIIDKYTIIIDKNFIQREIAYEKYGAIAAVLSLIFVLFIIFVRINPQ